MGIERDFLMRQLRMLFEVIQKIMLYRKKGQFDEAQEEIQYFYECLKLPENIHEQSIQSLMEYLMIERKLTNNHLEMVAAVFKEKGELAQNDEQRTELFKKALFMLKKVDRESTGFSMERQMKIGELTEYLS